MATNREQADGVLRTSASPSTAMKGGVIGGEILVGTKLTGDAHHRVPTEEEVCAKGYRVYR